MIVIYLLTIIAHRLTWLVEGYQVAHCEFFWPIVADGEPRAVHANLNQTRYCVDICAIVIVSGNDRVNKSCLSISTFWKTNQIGGINQVPAILENFIKRLQCTTDSECFDNYVIQLHLSTLNTLHNQWIGWAEGGSVTRNGCAVIRIAVVVSK